MSYGFTNFTWIWLWISKDKHLFEWYMLILMWWFVCPLLTNTFSPQDADKIIIQRTTGEYHGYMAAIMFAGYLILIIYNLSRDKEYRINIPRLLAIGILVQFGWEAGLLIGGIRSAGFATVEEKLRPLVVNSLLETNLGMPYIYFIFIAYSAKFTEQFKKRAEKLSICERIAENNTEKVREK